MTQTKVTELFGKTDDYFLSLIPSSVNRQTTKKGGCRIPLPLGTSRNHYFNLGVKSRYHKNPQEIFIYNTHTPLPSGFRQAIIIISGGHRSFLLEFTCESS